MNFRIRNAMRKRGESRKSKIKSCDGYGGNWQRSPLEGQGLKNLIAGSNPANRQ